MLLETVGLALLDTVAVLHALLTPLGADVVWDGLRVHGEIRGDTVVADAREGEVVLEMTLAC